ncbi:MAG: hypothetical protein EPO08_21135 [Rhodospirillaceae bacterium]|nr:MAG: hypothetical protein EPO08_21135 [Rhodospirillaceae bacterium]
MALKRIGKVGPVVILKGDGEYVCRIPGRRGADYFTSDLDDARATAKDMRDRLAVSPALRLVKP